MKKKTRHLLFLGIAALITLLPLFHQNLWFDEAYSVGMSSHTLKEIYNIGIHDVHPLLYYDLLHLAALLFHNSILAERIFSWLWLVLLSACGYKLLTKYYGETEGFLFALLILIFPSDLVYAGEIRMYTMVMFMVSMAAIYADIIMHHEDARRTRFAFALFCILAAYTHYYGLLSAAVMNILLFIHDWKHQQMKKWLLNAAVQILSYVPWLPVLLRQTQAVRENFWVEWMWPDSLFALIRFVFTGSLEDAVYLPDGPGIVFFIFFILIFLQKIRKKEGNIYLYIYLGVILISALASLIMHRVILYPRYLLVVQGCLLLYFSLHMQAVPQKEINVFLCLCLLCTGITFHKVMLDNYDPANRTVIDRVKEEIQPGDRILITNTAQNAGSFAFFEQLGQKEALYYNRCEWSDESILAYEALGSFTIVDEEDLKNLHGRIWYIFCSDEKKYYGQFEDTANLYGIWRTAPEKTFAAAGRYKNFYYRASLYEH